MSEPFFDAGLISEDVTEFFVGRESLLAETEVDVDSHLGTVLVFAFLSE